MSCQCASYHEPFFLFLYSIITSLIFLFSGFVCNFLCCYVPSKLSCTFNAIWKKWFFMFWVYMHSSALLLLGNCPTFFTCYLFLWFLQFSFCSNKFSHHQQWQLGSNVIIWSFMFQVLMFSAAHIFLKKSLTFFKCSLFLCFLQLSFHMK